MVKFGFWAFETEEFLYFFIRNWKISARKYFFCRKLTRNKKFYDDFSITQSISE